MKTSHRILLVDDEPAVIEGLRHALRKPGYEVLAATSGEHALRILGSTSVDVVVSDERMGGMPGSVLLARVCRDWPDTVRILLTGHATVESAVAAVNECQVFRLLLKPCRAADVAEAVRLGLQLKMLRVGSARLLVKLRERGAVIDQIERANPGITAVQRNDDGAIDLDADVAPDLEQLLADMERELGGPDSAAA